MYSQNARSEFIRLRVQGLSLAGIGRRLGVSKPTVIKWNRQCQTEIAAAASNLPSPASHLPDEIADLTRRLTALKQELFSRAVREFPTAALETIAGQYRQRLEALQPATSGGAPPATIGFHEGKADSDSNERPFADRLPTILPLPEGPQSAKRTSLDGHQSRGGVGNALGPG